MRGSAPPRAVVVNRTGNEFLTGAAFSSNQHRDIRRRDELNLLLHLSKTRTPSDKVPEVMSAADLFPQVGVLILESNLLLLHQNAVRDINEHRARVITANSRPGPPLDPHRLAVVLATQFKNDASGVGAVSDRVERLAQVALGVRRLGHERLAERPGDLFRLEAKDPHRGVVSLNHARIQTLMNVGDRGLVEKITEALLAMLQRLVGMAQLLTHAVLNLFGNLARRQS